MSHFRIRALFAGAFFTLGALSQAAESASSYPSQIVKIVVPYTPGGITDLLGRALASRLEKNGGSLLLSKTNLVPLRPLVLRMSPKANPMATPSLSQVTLRF